MAELTADVAVIGFGGAGATAAIEARDAGASVIILEKAETGGGTTQEIEREHSCHRRSRQGSGSLLPAHIRHDPAEGHAGFHPWNIGNPEMD